MLKVLPLALVVLPAVASAQQSLLYPPQARPGDLASSTNSPFRRSHFERALYVFDSELFSATLPPVSVPMQLLRVRLRADDAAGSWPGATVANVRLDASHSTRSHLDTVAEFDANHGADRTTIFDGPLVIPAGSAGGATPFFVELNLQGGFVFNPLRDDDLVLDFRSSGVASTGSVPLLDARAARIESAMRVTSIDPNATEGNVTRSIHAIEFQFIPPAVPVPAFVQDVQVGPAPLTVQFTDRSYTGDPGGVLAWSWDFDGDGVEDSTAQNPTFTFTGCGDFSPALTIVDATGSSTFVRAGSVRTDVVGAAFEAVSRSGAAPLTVQFQDLSSGSPTAWAWDFDGDGVTDSTQQNPVHTFASGFYDVTLTASRNCRSDTVTRPGYVVAQRGITTPLDGNDGLDPPGVQFGNLRVLRPEGIRITALDAHCQEVAGFPFSLDVYIASKRFVTITGDVGSWRKVASGSAVGNGLGVATLVDIDDFYLPPGEYGIAIQMIGARARYSISFGPLVTFSSPELEFDSGAGRFEFFAGFQRNNRVYNGAIYYDFEPTGALNAFGTGCAGSAGVAGIEMQAGTALRLGQTFGLDVVGLPAAEPLCLLFYGYNNSNWNGVPLPLGLTAFGMAGCTGRAEPFQTIVLLNQGGTAQWTAPVPNSPVLIGSALFFQSLVIDGQAGNSLGAVMSDAAAGVVGN